MQFECEAKPEDRHEYDISCILYHAPYVYTASDDGKIKMWDEKDLRLVSEVLAVDEVGYSVYSMSAAPRSGILYSCSNDGKLRSWNLRDLSASVDHPLVTADQNRELWRVHCDEPSGRVYTLDDQGMVKVYDMKNFTCLAEIPGMEQLKDVTGIGDFLFTVRDLDVTCSELTPAQLGKLRPTTRATFMGRAPLCLLQGDPPSLAFTTRDGRSIVIHAADKERKFEKLCDITGASDKLINAICSGHPDRHILYSAGFDNKVSAWDISGNTGKPAMPSIEISHLINGLASSPTAIYAAGSNGMLTKIRIL